VKNIRVFSMLCTLIISLFIMTGTALAGTSYAFLRSQLWKAPEESPVDLGILSIEIDPIMEGKHVGIFALPPDFKITLPGNIPGNEDPLIVFTTRQLSDNEFIGTINTIANNQKVTFLVPIKTTIPRDSSGDIELVITGLEGQIWSQNVVAGQVFPGEVVIESKILSVIQDNKSSVQIRIEENMLGLINQYNYIKFTLPEGFKWDKVQGKLESGAGLEIEPLIDKDKRVLILKVNNLSSQRSVFCINAEIILEDPGKAPDGEVRALIEGLNSLSSKYINVAYYEKLSKEENEQGAEASQKTIIEIGNKNFLVDGKEFQTDVAPYIRNGRVFVSLRHVATILEINDITWDRKNVDIQYDNSKLRVDTFNSVIYANNEKRIMDITADIISPGRVMLPYRYIADAFDINMFWDQEKQIIIIEK